ncbi:hypothetical protein JWG39_10040 [Desulforhopalus vacuolatus]|uniref:hypothetical protein n=1 Tax=Desulforhopalus vacuolatus TaxID=40414 RepID=UPI0019626932|nr:hypothetical protein [Desulforhopalus vacuolatus]MBM9520154.1 hypothetical protein [Desulforhopalus vacuolatus]
MTVQNFEAIEMQTIKGLTSPSAAGSSATAASTLSPAARATAVRQNIAMRREANIRKNAFFNIPDKNPEQIRLDAVQSILGSRTQKFRTSAGGRFFLLGCAILLMLFILLFTRGTAEAVNWIIELPNSTSHWLIWPTGGIGLGVIIIALRSFVHCLRVVITPGPRCILKKDRIICPSLFGNREFNYDEIIKVSTSCSVQRKRHRLFNELLIYTLEDKKPARLDISGLPEAEELFATIDDIISWLHTEKFDSAFMESMDQLAHTTPNIIKTQIQKEFLKRLFGSSENIRFMTTTSSIMRDGFQFVLIGGIIATAWYLMTERAPFSFSCEYIALMFGTLLAAAFMFTPLLYVFRVNPPFILHHDMIECACAFQRHTFFLKEIQKSKVIGRETLYMSIKNRRYLLHFPAKGINPPAHIMEYALNGLIHISEKDFLSFRALIEKDVRFQDAREEYLKQAKTTGKY